MTNANRLVGLIFAMLLLVPSIGYGGSDDGMMANFRTLMGASWKATAIYSGWFLFKIFLGAVLGGLVGLLVGFILFRIAKRCGLLGSDWKWYPWVRWAWAPVFCLSLTIAFANVGAWKGCGVAVEHAVYRDRVPRKLIANCYAAVALNTRGYQLKGDETAEDVMKLMAQGDALKENTLKTLGERVRTIMHMEPSIMKEMSFLERFLVSRLSDQEFGEAMARAFWEEDPRLALIAIYEFGIAGSPHEAELRGEDNHLLALAVSSAFDALDNTLVSQVDSLINQNMWLSILVGLGLPGGMIAILRIGDRCRRSPVSKETQESSLEGR